MFWNWELLKESIGAMSLRLGAHTSSTGFNIGLNRGSEFWPNIVLSNQINSLVLTEVSGEWAGMIVLQNSKPEVTHIRHIDVVVKM